jgi:hypothetical protein
MTCGLAESHRHWRVGLCALDGESENQTVVLESGSCENGGRPTVIGWRARHEQSGMMGLVDRRRSGRPREFDHGEIVSATLVLPPGKLVVTHWDSRLLADHLRISFSAAAKVWRRCGIQPWRVPGLSRVSLLP